MSLSGPFNMLSMVSLFPFGLKIYVTLCSRICCANSTRDAIYLKFVPMACVSGRMLYFVGRARDLNGYQ